MARNTRKFFTFLLLTPDQKVESSNLSGLIFLPAKTTAKAFSIASDTSAPSTLDNSGGKTCSPTPWQLRRFSASGTRTRVDYSGLAHQISRQTKAGNNSLRPCTSFPHSSFSPQQPQMVPSGLEPETLWLLAIRSDQLSYETSCWPVALMGDGFMIHFLFAYLKTAHHSQSARVVKGVDLRALSTTSWRRGPVGLMDKALVLGTKDCRFDPARVKFAACLLLDCVLQAPGQTSVTLSVVHKRLESDSCGARTHALTDWPEASALDHSPKLSCSTWQSVWPSKDLCCLGKWSCTVWLEPGRIKHGSLGSAGQSVRLLTSRSGVRASQKAYVALPVMNQQGQGPRTFMGIQGAKL